jgi:cysteinyl-tRNA synthetase
MKLYNTLTRKVEELQPIKAGEVTMYTCGPTVYDYYHIGNLRNAVFNDTLRRTLESSGYNVRHVMNITDVGHLVSDADEGEDKLEKGARREGKTVWEVAEHYTDAFKHDMASLNVLPPNVYQSQKYGDTYARATEFIEQQIEMVGILLEKGFAYQTRQAIYFDVTKLPDYGILSGQKLVDKEIGARSDVVTDSDKRSPHDFAVWFFAVGHFEGHSMQWDSPWGSGFPGWHLECSAIIHGTLGDPIDIHTGGVDHIGTHHPNEMAQTEAAFGHPLAHFWVHNEFILVDGAKMAKSKGNSYTLREVIDRDYDPLAYRLLVLQAHYRSELNFTWKALNDAQNRLRRYWAAADRQFQPQRLDKFGQLLQSWIKSHTLIPGPILGYLQNDLASTQVLVWVDKYFKMVIDNGLCEEDIDAFKKHLEFIDKILGLGLASRRDLSSIENDLIAKREKARKNSEWEIANRLRDELKSEYKIVINDTPQGPIWSRI